jgi:hypothetical protein
MDHWIQWISGEVKDECISTLARSREIEDVRYGSKRVIDWRLEFWNFRVRSVEESIFGNP